MVRCFRQSADKGLRKADDFEMVPGRGVAATVDGIRIMSGNPEMMAENGVEISQAQQPKRRHIVQTDVP